MDHLDQTIKNILERNARVEAAVRGPEGPSGPEREKAWEQSWTRRGLILLFTYVIATVFLRSIAIPLPYVQALVPTLGYFLSTLSIPWVKKWWMRHYAYSDAEKNP